jgi:hypothetical protein
MVVSTEPVDHFQAVSTAQKLNTSNYYPDPKNTAMVKNGLGGYTDDGTTPGVVLQSALTFVDDKLADILNDKAFRVAGPCGQRRVRYRGYRP